MHDEFELRNVKHPSSSLPAASISLFSFVLRASYYMCIIDMAPVNRDLVADRLTTRLMHFIFHIAGRNPHVLAIVCNTSQIVFVL